MSEGKIYLDYNATTPLAPEVLEVINVAHKDFWANPSSAHEAGVRAKQCISEARGAVARMINVDPSDIIFTSCGTESNNMLFHSIAPGTTPPPHVIISNLDHLSVALTAKNFQKMGFIELTVVEADPSSGHVRPEDIVSALRPTTKLISLVLANNETGVIQPVREVVRLVREWEGKGEENQGRTIFIHTDAAQAIGKIPVDARELGVDYMTIAGHKFYGPRAGALYVRRLDSKATPLAPMLCGGGQERGYRSGTENTGMIAGLGRAAELVTDNVTSYGDHMRSTRDYLEQQLEESFGSRVHFNGRYKNSERIPNTCNVSIIGKPFRGFEVVSKLKHCEASIGAACHSHGSCKASPVLMACGVPEGIAANALRLSIGRETSKQDIDVFMKDLKEAVSSLESN